MTTAETFAFADLWEQATDLVPERTAVVCGDQRRTYAELEERSNRLAHELAGRGVRRGDHVAVYLENCPEYVEAMLACFKIGAAPININYRYVAKELRYLFDNSDSVGIIHAPKHGDVVDELLPSLRQVGWTLTTGDDYERALGAAPAERFDRAGRSGDDPYVIYTGGTTGLPKGVVWRQEDAFFACIGGGDPMRMAGEVSTAAEVAERMVDNVVYYALAPLMHAAAQWTLLMWLYAGGTVVLMEGSLDAEAVWDTVAAEKVNILTVVGDAVAKPLLDAWDANPGRWDASSLFVIGNGAAPLSPGSKARLVARFPNVLVTDGFGSSEAGIQGASRVSAADAPGGTTTTFSTAGSKPTLVLGPDDKPVEPGSGVIGRIVTGGHLPIGYYNDPEKTAATFIEVDGERYLVTGDQATVSGDGEVELLGRGSVSINTGGEKVFPEEVESVLHGHPDVVDVLVVGVPDERWGSAVTAVVAPAPGATPTLDELADHCRQQLAGYKVPKRLVLVDQIVRSPSGKADYRWAAETAAATTVSG